MPDPRAFGFHFALLLFISLLNMVKEARVPDFDDVRMALQILQEEVATCALRAELFGISLMTKSIPSGIFNGGCTG